MGVLSYLSGDKWGLDCRQANLSRDRFDLSRTSRQPVSEISGTIRYEVRQKRVVMWKIVGCRKRWLG